MVVFLVYGKPNKAVVLLHHLKKTFYHHYLEIQRILLVLSDNGTLSCTLTTLLVLHQNICFVYIYMVMELDSCKQCVFAKRCVVVGHRNTATHYQDVPLPSCHQVTYSLLHRC